VGVYTVVALATLAVFPSSLLVTLVTGSHRLGHRLHARLWGQLILALCGVSLRVHGLERLSGDRAYVLMCNHASHFDGYAVAAALPLQWRAVLGAWIRPIPVFGWIGMLAGHVFLDRSRSGRAIRTLNEAVAKIRGGLSVLIFPEGTFNDGGPLSPFKRGGFHLAVAAGVPVVPMTVVETVVGPIRRVRAIDLYIGAPEETSGLNHDALPDLMASVRTEMARHEPPDRTQADRLRRPAQEPLRKRLPAAKHDPSAIGGVPEPSAYHGDTQSGSAPCGSRISLRNPPREPLHKWLSAAKRDPSAIDGVAEPLAYHADTRSGSAPCARGGSRFSLRNPLVQRFPRRRFAGG
jgi:1-acyl-sn-glycerol-3-phosphate acyltransferase